MQLVYLVTVNIEDRAVMEDNPPENIQESVMSEIVTHLEDSSVRRALGVKEADVRLLMSHRCETPL